MNHTADKIVDEAHYKSSDMLQLIQIDTQLFKFWSLSILSMFEIVDGLLDIDKTKGDWQRGHLESIIKKLLAREQADHSIMILWKLLT